MGGRVGLRLVAAAGVVTALAALAAPVAGADGTTAQPRSVVASGRAQGFRATYTIPDYVIVSEFFDGGGPVTDAVVDSTGRATSFASLPWPGENAVTAPGTLSAAFGQSVPLAYPFHVRADHPTTPSAELRDPTGAYGITAAAAAGRADASGALQGGDGVSGSRAQSSAVLDDAGVVRVVAETIDTGLSIGDGVLRIAAVRSRSETTLAPDDAKPVTHSRLIIEGATVAGQPVTIDANGVHLAGQTVPAPVGRGVSTDNDLLGQAGISVTVSPTGRPGSADALVITSRQTIPAPNNPKGALVMRFGGASSEIVVGSADLPVLDAPAPAEPPVEQAAVSGTAGEATESGTPASSELAPAQALPGERSIGVDIGAARTEVRETRPAAPAVSSEAAALPAAMPGRETELRAATGRRAAPAPVVPDLATTGALFSLLAFGGLGLLVATRLHRFKVMKVRGWHRWT
ncbi:MAG: hypothetical protein AB1679_03290 [Actinomycetota bacterium]